MRKTALLTGVAGLFLMSAPAYAQDGTAPQTPPSTATTQAPTLSLQPGATVRGSDGELGVLVGARLNGGRQQLTVQGADGVVRAVPIDGIRQEGEVVVVDFTLEQYNAAETVTQPATPATPADPGVTPATPATPAVPGVSGEDDADMDEEADEGQDPAPTPATPAVPATPAQPGVTPAVPATPAEPATPPEQTPPTLPPETPAAPKPGEGAGAAPGKPNG